MVGLSPGAGPGSTAQTAPEGPKGQNVEGHFIRTLPAKKLNVPMINGADGYETAPVY